MRSTRVTTVLAIIVALAIGHLITSRLEVTQVENPPFTRTAGLGETAALSYADVEVTDVRPAQYLAPDVSDELARRAGGVWVLVSVAVTPTREPLRIASAVLVDRDDRLMRTSAKSTCGVTLRSPTGVTTYTLYCFDVPADRLAGLRFRLARGNLDDDLQRGDDLADIDLEVSSSDEVRWAATTDAYVVPDTSLEPIELATTTLEEQAS